MASYFDQDSGSAGSNKRTTEVPKLLLRLPVVSQFHRILKNWQSEFKPRRYDNQYALSSIKWQDARTQPRKY